MQSCKTCCLVARALQNTPVQPSLWQHCQHFVGGLWVTTQRLLGGTGAGGPADGGGRTLCSSGGGVLRGKRVLNCEG